MIRYPTVNIRLPCGAREKAKEIYLAYKARIATFAAAFGGDKHSLRRLVIEFNRPFPLSFYPPSCLRTCQNVLEPFASIYGLGRNCSLNIHGVTDDFEETLCPAMENEKYACVPEEREYGMRMVAKKGSRGKKTQQKYVLGSYHDTELLWMRGRIILLSFGVEVVHRCCEVCTRRAKM